MRFISTISCSPQEHEYTIYMCVCVQIRDYFHENIWTTIKTSEKRVLYTYSCM